MSRALSAALVATVVLLGTLLADDAVAQDRAAMEQRLQRLERMLDSSGMMQLLESVKGLQREVRELRGEIEVQANTINRLKKNQVKLYDDIDQRLQTIESAPPPAAPPAVATGPTAPSTPDRPTSAPATAPGSDERDPVKEQQAYQSAFNLLKAGRYEKAAGSFRKFLATYSGGKYADNAQYWLGETYYVTRQFETALREFDLLLSQYPESQKRSHAMLKLGYIRDELGQKAQARKVLQQLISTYPNSTAAGLARKRLDRISE